MTEHQDCGDDAASLPTVPGVTLQCEIARGGMGVVYRGRQHFVDRLVAVKLLSPHLQGDRFAARFQREARILAGIKHPNIVACHLAGTTGSGQSFLVMEHVDGPNLEAYLGEHGALAVPVALRLARQLASALGHAAELGVIHRDVKLGNILLESPTSTAVDLAFPFVPKLVDLGLARMAHETGDLGLTSPGTVMGTPLTMAPEQFDAPDAVDFRADIYGLGCVLFQLLTGAPAFASTKLTEVVVAKRQGPAPDPCARDAAIPRGVGRLVQRMLAGDADGRPASYRELIAELDQLAAEPPARAASPRPAEAKLLQTAEIDFLTAGGACAAPSAPVAFPEPSSVAIAVPAAVPVAAPKQAAAPRPRVIGTPASRRRGPAKKLVVGAVAGAVVLAAVPMLWPLREPTPIAPPSSPPLSPSLSPSPARAVAILGLDGFLRPDAPIALRASAPGAAGDLRYRWQASPSAIAVIEDPAAAAATLRLRGLPGDAFEVALAVDDGHGAALHARRTAALAYPADDLLEDFLAKDSQWLGRGRLRGEWSRRDEDGAVECPAQNLPAFRSRPVRGTTWRVNGKRQPGTPRAALSRRPPSACGSGRSRTWRSSASAAVRANAGRSRCRRSSATTPAGRSRCGRCSAPRSSPRSIAAARSRPPSSPSRGATARWCGRSGCRATAIRSNTASACRRRWRT
ncbi:MAG: serine/threonine-protein kinase [Planctomycetota bacterium]